MNKFAYSINELPGLVSVGRTRIYEAISRGELKVRKYGNRTLVLHEDLMAWLQSLPEAAR